MNYETDPAHKKLKDNRVEVPAFPISHSGVSWSPEMQGMTLRDYFAAKAMAATMVTIREEPRTPENALAVVIETVATGAYLFADAMLKAREK